MTEPVGDDDSFRKAIASAVTTLEHADGRHERHCLGCDRFCCDCELCECCVRCNPEQTAYDVLLLPEMRAIKQFIHDAAGEYRDPVAWMEAAGLPASVVQWVLS